MDRPVVIRIRRALVLYALIVLAGMLAWGAYSGSFVAAVLMGTYVGATVAIAMTVVYVLHVGIENVEVRWS